MDIDHEYEYVYISDTEKDEKGKPLVKEAGRHSLRDIVDPMLWPDSYRKPHTAECDCGVCPE